MDQKSQEFLDQILKKNPDELTPDEVQFLRSRRSYLKKIQLDEYESVLNPKHQTSDESEPVKKHGKTSSKN